jgi:hypothetical protein
VQHCLECLLECFQARRVDAGDYELDEVSAYRGSIMQGIGITKHGHYSRKLADELGIPRKRAFETTQHALSKGFEELSVPSNKETLMIEFNESMRQKQSDEFKLQVARMG